MSVVTIFQLRKALEVAEQHAAPKGFKHTRYRNIEIETAFPDLIVSTDVMRSRRSFVIDPHGLVSEMQDQEAA